MPNINYIVIDKLYSPAIASGLKIHDVIVSINGVKPRDVDHFAKLSKKCSLTLKLKIQRFRKNRLVHIQTRQQIKKLNTIVKLKYELKKDFGISKDQLSKKKDALVETLWVQRLIREVAKDHLLSIFVTSQDRHGLNGHELSQRCGGLAVWQSHFKNALDSGTLDGTFIQSSGGRYKLSTSN